MARDHKRHRKFIKSSEQLLIAAEIILHSLFFLALISLFLFAPPFVTIGSQYSLVEHQAIAKELVVLNAGKWYLFVGLVLFLGVVSILFSHQIVGPTYHFEMVLRALREKKLFRKARIRKWDYFRETQDELNEHIDALQEDIGTLKRVLTELHSRIESEIPEKKVEFEGYIKEMDNVLNAYELNAPEDGSPESVE